MQFVCVPSENIIIIYIGGQSNVAVCICELDPPHYYEIVQKTYPIKKKF